MTKFALSKTSKRVLAAFCALCTAITLASCGSSNDKTQASSAKSSTNTAKQIKEDTGTLRVAYLTSANYLTTLSNNTKMANKIFGKAKVTFSGPYVPPEANTAVTSGNADVTTTGSGHFIHFISKGQPWVAYAINYYNGNAQGIVAAPNSGIKTLKDLYGKKIGIIAKGGSGDYIIHKAFEKAGLDPSKVQEVEMSPKNFHAAFTTGQVDALATFDQNFAAALATPGAKLLVTAKDYGNINFGIQVASAEFAKKHPQLLKKMYRALVEEGKRVKKKHSIILDMYKKFGASDETMKELAKFDIPQIRPMNAETMKMLKQQAKEYVKYGFIKEVPDFSKAVIDCSK
ncbi:ABC transporter substrate-binding protein [Gardnerella vaginalis]|uniref:ABC transporter substrate-binding protein n=1 Tax=Gardnerella vaginalis TaxID=2702 RepID=UPI0039F141F3